MSSDEEIAEFIHTTFRSVWALEMLLLMAGHGEREWVQPELVDALRASELIVTRALDDLAMAGLIVIERDGAARFQPASQHSRALVASTATFYAKSPDKVRRIIVGRASNGLNAFAAAFRIRKD